MGDSDMLDFIRQYIICVVFVVMGLFLIIGNISIMISHRFKKTHSSGIPFLGGLLIAIGFLTTPKPFKYLALLGLLDPTIWMLFVSFYYCKNEDAILEKRYASFLSEHGFTTVREDDDLKIASEIIYKGREEFPHTQEYYYKTNKAFRVGYPWALMMVTEKDGKRFLVLDTGTEGNLKKLDPEKISIHPFEENTVILHDVAEFLEGQISIRIVKKDDPEHPADA